MARLWRWTKSLKRSRPGARTTTDSVVEAVVEEIRTDEVTAAEVAEVAAMLVEEEEEEDKRCLGRANGRKITFTSISKEWSKKMERRNGMEWNRSTVEKAMLVDNVVFFCGWQLCSDLHVTQSGDCYYGRPEWMLLLKYQIK